VTCTTTYTGAYKDAARDRRLAKGNTLIRCTGNSRRWEAQTAPGSVVLQLENSTILE